MNRFNFGNVTTNGMQILSVGATTAARTLGRADKTLNNLSEDEKKALGKMKSDKLRDQINRYNTGGESATQHLSEQELTDYRKKQADDIRKKTYGSGEESIDAIMEGAETDPLPLIENSGQVKPVKTKAIGDNEWLTTQQQFREWYNKNLKGKHGVSNIAKSDFNKIVERRK